MRIFIVNKQKIHATDLRNAIWYFLLKNKDYKASRVEVEDNYGKKISVKIERDKKWMFQRLKD